MKKIILLAVLLTFFECSEKVKYDNRLPILGNPKIVESVVNGKLKIDTIPHSISNFKFLNQDSSWVTNETFKDKIYIADFFFTSCPSICPIMKTQMLRVYQTFKNNPNVAILSHTIDPEYDDVKTLNNFAKKLGVSSDQWHFVTGNRDSIFTTALRDYMVVTEKDSLAPGGLIHSGAFLLVDKERHIRGVYDGTDNGYVSILINDISDLLKEYKEREEEEQEK